MEAWGALARRQYVAAVNYLSDSAGTTQSRAILTRALRRAPFEPNALVAAAMWAWYVDGSRVAAESLATKALSRSWNDATTLAITSDLLGIWYPDSARTLAVRAAQLDPRSALNLHRAANTSLLTRRFVDARHYGEALVAMDSADDRGWRILLSLETLRGDTVAMQQLSAHVMRNVNRPSYQLACFMTPSSTKLSAWYLSLSASTQRVASLVDSVYYYDCKTDAALRLQNVKLARAYSDSIIALLSPSRMAKLPSPPWAMELTSLAYAHANAGNRSEALQIASGIVDAGRRTAGQDTLPTTFEPETLASIYAASGDADSAVRWLKVALRQGYSVRWFKISPRLRPLHGTAAFERFVREHDR